MTVTAEGLRIELMETETGTFFASGASDLNKSGHEILKHLAEELAKLPNKLSIEGHTDAKPFTGKSDYSNWELSADRANAARRLLQQNGMRADQVTQVRGYADQRLRKPDAPEDAVNRRISLIVQYLEKDLADDEEEEEEKDAKKSGKHGAAEKKPADKGHEKPKGAHGTPAKSEHKPSPMGDHKAEQKPAKSGH
jgi:chemotaxis protein MotB